MINPDISESELTLQSATFEKEVVLKDDTTAKIPGKHISNMTLYHGSPVADISMFDLEKGEAFSMGKGVYLAGDHSTAMLYSKNRRNKDASSYIYQEEIENLDLADLRSEEAQYEFAKLFKQALLEWEEKVLPALQHPIEPVLRIIKDQRREQIKSIIERIDAKDFPHLGVLTLGWGELITNTLQAQGFNGAIGIEGEPPHIPFHTSYVIFDPNSLKRKSVTEIK